MFVLIIITVFISLLCWLYVFDTYEVKYFVEYIDDHNLAVNATPLNAFGIKVPFKKIMSEFRIVQGFEGVTLNSGGEGAAISWQNVKYPDTIKIGAKNSYSHRENIITIPIKLSEEI